MNAGAEIMDATLLRRAFGAFATGVIVVTVGGGAPHGMTANSFTSVSLDPPLVLVCVGRSAIMHQRLRAARCFGVSVLAAGQEAIARHFANELRELGPAQFSAVGWRPGRVTGVPLIGAALARFECDLWRSHDAGDHTIFIGRLRAMDWSAEGEALMFFRGKFGEFSLGKGQVRA